MKERPIIFSAPMVRAILDGRKTQTRRLVKPVRRFEQYNICKPDWAADPWAVWWHGDVTDRVGVLQEAPHGKPGDVLWVRETWGIGGDGYEIDPTLNFKADGSQRALDPTLNHMRAEVERCFGRGWRSPIHMPRWASRLRLLVKSVRVERLQDITEEDARAEGSAPWEFGYDQRMTSGERGADQPYRGGFACLWDDMHSNGPFWLHNPWVWAYEFERTA